MMRLGIKVLMITCWRWSVQVKRIGEDLMRVEEEKERDPQLHQDLIADSLPGVIVINQILKDIV